VRYRPKSTPTFSLFPFLNVLVSLLGVLIMIVLAISAISLGAGRTVRINVTQTGADYRFQPVYIEWDGQSVVLHPGEIEVPGPSALENNGNNESLFGRFLDRLEANRETEYLIVAVKPAGFHNFGQLRETILVRGIRIGYEPIDTSWDLSTGKVSGS